MSSFDDKLRNLFSSDGIENNANSNVHSTNNDDSNKIIVEEEEENNEPKKLPQETLMVIAKESIKILFKDQYSEGFASIFVKDHCEVIPLSSNRFKRFLSKIYYETQDKIANTESVNNVVNILQAKAEFGDIQYHLNLRVAEHDGDIYYDLTNGMHQTIKISQNGDGRLYTKHQSRCSKDTTKHHRLCRLPSLCQMMNKTPLKLFFQTLQTSKTRKQS